MQSIGSRLKAWRDENKLSQKEAAAHFGVPSRTYQDYERNLKAPGAGAIESFVRAGINANWLLTGHGPMLWQDLLDYARQRRDAAVLAEHRWAIVSYALRKVERRWFVTAVSEPEHSLNNVVDDYNAGRILNHEALRQAIPSITVEELCEWGGEALAWGDRISKTPGLFPGLVISQQQPTINEDALTQAFCAMMQTAPKGEPLQQTARKAAAFYLYMVEKGLITPEGQGDGHLKAAS